MADLGTLPAREMPEELLQVFALGGEIDARQDLHLAQLLVGVDGHQGAGHRTAHVDPALTLARGLADLFPKLLDRVVGRTIQHDPKRPLVAVMDQQHHRANEVRVEQMR